MVDVKHNVFLARLVTELIINVVFVLEQTVLNVLVVLKVKVLEVGSQYATVGFVGQLVLVAFARQTITLEVEFSVFGLDLTWSFVNNA